MHKDEYRPVLLLEIAIPSNVYLVAVSLSEMTGERWIKGFWRGYIHLASGRHSRFLKPGVKGLTLKWD